MMDYLINLDYSFTRFFNIGMSNLFFDAFMILITHLGSIYLWFLISVAMFMIRKRDIGMRLFTGVSINAVLVNMYKYLIMRARPEEIIEGMKVLVSEGTPSFPSGHTSTAFVSAVILSNYYPRYNYLFYSLAILVGLSRIYVGVHFFSDVFVGAFHGIVIGLFILRLPLTKYVKAFGL